jgi:hypothetical protein
MFLKYLAKMDLILMLSKFSGQIGRKVLTGMAVLMESALGLKGILECLTNSKLHLNNRGYNCDHANKGI